MGGCVRYILAYPRKIKTQTSQISLLFNDDIEQQRFKNGKPILLASGLKIRKNPQTNKLEGIPEQWLTNVKLPLDVDYERVVRTGGLRKQIRPDDEFPQAILQLINRKSESSSSHSSSKIQSPPSSPTLTHLQSNLSQSDLISIALTDSKMESHLSGQHSSYIKKSNPITIPIQVDKQKPYGLKNLPEQWVTTVTGSFMDPKEINDPIALATIISHYDQAVRMTIKQKQLLSTEEFQKRVKKVKFFEDHPNNNFIFLQQIGKGGVCKVFKAEARFAPETYYAVRIMKQKDINTLNKIRCQIAVMQLCNSPNIVDYNFTYYYKESLFMFIQYMDAGNLTTFIQTFYKKIPQRIIAYILKQILKGLLSIHQHYQIHRDIKSDNILLSQNGKIKIADFGYALQLTADKGSGQGLAGTAPWMAPELIKKEEYDQGVDIWSLGIVGVQLVEGQPPYLRLQPLRAMYKIASQQPPVLKNVSEKFGNFIANCLKKDPTQRWSAKQLLQHPFIQQIGQGNLEKQQFLQMLKKHVVLWKNMRSSGISNGSKKY